MFNVQKREQRKDKRIFKRGQRNVVHACSIKEACTVSRTGVLSLLSNQNLIIAEEKGATGYGRIGRNEEVKRMDRLGFNPIRVPASSRVHETREQGPAANQWVPR